MQQTAALAEEDVRRVLWTVDADLKTALALSRATLHALADLSPSSREAVDAALEEETERARLYEPTTTQRVTAVIEELRSHLQQSSAEARMTRQLELALMAAADALPDEGERDDREPRRSVG